LNCSNKGMTEDNQRPFRFTVMTYNVWGRDHLHARVAPLRAFFTKFKPDILAIQEADHVIHVIDKFLLFGDFDTLSATPTLSQSESVSVSVSVDQLKNGSHLRVFDDFPSWVVEENIYWNKSLFTKLAHGFVDITIKPTRGLSWVRLQLNNTNDTIFVATVHLTWIGCKEERDDAIIPRIRQTNQILSNLKRLVKKGERCILLGDFNDPFHPRRIIERLDETPSSVADDDDILLFNSFKQLCLKCEPTFPTSACEAPEEPMQVWDWIFATPSLTPLTSQVVKFNYYMKPGEWPNPSDHYPILATYQW